MMHGQNTKGMTVLHVPALPSCTLPYIPEDGFSQGNLTSSE